MDLWRIFTSLLCLTILSELEVQCCEEGELRLNASEQLPSPAGNVGRLELCLGQQWGTIALKEPTNFWSAKNTQVACVQLGFSGGLNSIPPSHIPDAAKSPSDLRVHLRSVACLGEESHLLNCSSSRVSSADTSPSQHQRDVFVVCRPREGDYSDLHVAGEQIGDVQLFGDVTSGRGAVQILTSVGWTGVCPEDWITPYARIVCQALGYDLGSSQTVNVSNASVSRLVFDASCSNSLTTPPSSRVQGGACSFQMVTQPDNCRAPEESFAGVKCGVRDSSSEHPIRFFGHGRFDSSKAVGVVEIFMDQRWGMVCDREPENVSQINAEVLCKQFFANPSSPSIEGKTVRIPVSSLRLHQSHLKPMWSNGLVCPASASDVNDCVFEEPLGFSDCSSGHILALDCGSSEVTREDNMTAIIVGIVVTVFVFVLAVLIFAKVFFTIFRRRRDIVAVNTSSYALSLPDAGLQLQDNQAAAINAYYDEDAKLSDDVASQEKGGVGQGKEASNQQDHKLTG